MISIVTSAFIPSDEICKVLMDNLIDRRIYLYAPSRPTTQTRTRAQAGRRVKLLKMHNNSIPPISGTNKFIESITRSIYLHRLDVYDWIHNQVDIPSSPISYLYFITFCKFIPVEYQNDYFNVHWYAFSSR